VDEVAKELHKRGTGTFLGQLDSIAAAVETMVRDKLTQLLDSPRPSCHKPRRPRRDRSRG
jgi:hypothetical protein